MDWPTDSASARRLQLYHNTRLPLKIYWKSSPIFAAVVIALHFGVHRFTDQRWIFFCCD